ncbi:MAG TPA: pitrilysin family protein [Syntrophorhabdales bacterium]|nr:pitrilysin family protein [Syntrophorhabdales bacterium]
MYRKTVLDNGIRIATETLPYFPTISIGIWWKTGSRYENPGNNGISHFIEHMLFKGTANRTAYDIAREIDAVGGTLNAFTGKEYTCIYARVLKRDMDIALDILADMYKTSLFNGEDIEKEKQVIIQEIKMIDDNPEEYLFDMFSSAYYKGHPLGMSILGKEENIQGMSREKLLSHFARYHAPSNMIITASGRLDHDAFVKKVENLFAECVNKGETPTSVEKPSSCTGIDVYEKDLEHIYLCIGTDGVGQTDERRYPLYALNAVVGGSMSSHLFQEIREKRGLVYNIFSYVNCFHDAGTFGITTSTSLEYLEEVIGLIKKEMAQLRDQGVAAGEIRFSKEHIKGNFFISLESSEARMGRLAKNEIYFDGYVPLRETLKSIDGIQKSHLDEMSQSVFGDPSRISLAILGRVEKDVVERLWKN